MKIYPSRHYITEEDRIKPGDIPLSCLVTDAKEKRYSVESLIPKSSGTRMETVLPYDEFEIPDPYLFDRELRRVEVTNKMIRTENGYAFFPPNSKEFNPTVFDYRVTIKNEGSYRSDINYNITVGCIEPENEIASNLVKIFGNSFQTGMAPPNVIINNGDLKHQSFTNLAINDCDFIFIQSEDGIHYKGTDTVIDLESFLNENVNVWIVADDIEGFDYTEMDTTAMSELMTSANVIRKPKEGFNLGYDILFKNSTELPPMIDPNYYEKVVLSTTDCEPAIIAERTGKGYVIFSKVNSILWGDRDPINIIYEIMMDIYLKKYEKTKWFSTWITDEKVDYLPRQELVFGRTHEKINVRNLLDENSTIRNSDSLSVIDVEIEGNVILKSISADYEIFFIKNGGTIDPEKEAGSKSYYTTRNSVIYYKEESVNRVETSLDIKIVSTSKGDYLQMKRFKSTSLKIDTMDDQEVRVPDNLGLFYVCVKNNMVNITTSGNYNEEVNGVKIATVRSDIHSVIKNYDARKMGGGLPENETSNYNLLDISHIKGKPHRKGGYIIARIPKEIAEHKDLIDSALRKHVSSGDSYFIVTEE